ncbi:unnamed protein product [Cyclocybe aegerita]|uniref:3-hydroxyisobutyrate dehydrogenase n=1 Tax=Cyclocybe aegerita TaxID=1973307 RepID=A0A8S0W368_CYCAE|nr:unnamed protein product [Cyclocybe aegerita]
MDSNADVDISKTFGWIGLGAMGFPMAQQLHKKIPSNRVIYVYDIDTSAVERFIKATTAVEQEAGDAKAKVVAAGCAKEVAEKADCIVTIVPEGTHVKSVFLTPDIGILAANDISGKIFIDCSTIDIATSLFVAQSVQFYHQSTNPRLPAPHFFDAPVSGGTAGASRGTLSILLGCSPTSPRLALLTRILRTMGTHIHVLGGPSLGLAAKLSNNYLSGLIALATSEAMNLGMRLGVDAKVLQKCFSTSSGGNWVNDTVNPVPGVCPDAVTSRGYEGGFKVQLMKKDMGLAIDAANQVGARIVLGHVGYAAYAAASEDLRCRDKDSRVVYRWHLQPLRIEEEEKETEDGTVYVHRYYTDVPNPDMEQRKKKGHETVEECIYEGKSRNPKWRPKARPSREEFLRKGCIRRDYTKRRLRRPVAFEGQELKADQESEGQQVLVSVIFALEEWPADLNVLSFAVEQIQKRVLVNLVWDGIDSINRLKENYRGV